MRYLTTINLILWTLVSCFGLPETNVEIVDHYKTKWLDVAIFPANYKDLILGQRFTPTQHEVKKAEISLKENLKTLNQPLVYQTPNNTIIKKN